MIETWCLSKELLELNRDMASLDLQELENVSSTDVNKPHIRRSSRIKHKVHVPDQVSGKQNSKIKCNDEIKEIEKYYLSKDIKRKPSRLETIYETPKESNNTYQYMSVKKFKRTINFEDENSQLEKKKRSKRRSLKAKKVTAGNRKALRKKVSMDILLNKLGSIDEHKECSPE